AIIAITVIVSITAFAGITVVQGNVTALGDVYNALLLNKADIASGQLWRLLTVTLVHSPDGITDFVLHLGFNMYALYLVGPVVEQIYGSRRMLFMYLATAVTASTASFAVGPPGD